MLSARETYGIRETHTMALDSGGGEREGGQVVAQRWWRRQCAAVSGNSFLGFGR